jgi:hypothetical protein
MIVPILALKSEPFSIPHAPHSYRTVAVPAEATIRFSHETLSRSNWLVSYSALHFWTSRNGCRRSAGDHDDHFRTSGNGLLRRALVLDVQNFSNCATLQRGQASQVNPDVWIYSAATRRYPLRAPRPKTMWFSDVRKPLRRALILERPELGYSATLAEFLNWTTAKVEAVLNALAIQPREPGVPQEEHPKVLFYF